MTFTYGQASSATDLPFSASSFGSYINNQDQVYYAALDSTGTYLIPYVYAISTGTTTEIPPIAGNSCADDYTISLSNANQLLGYTGSCAVPADRVYWTWDAVNGTQNLNAQIPPNTDTIVPLAVNDNGQILVSLTTSAGAIHWGTLNPSAPPMKAWRNRPAVRFR